VAEVPGLGLGGAGVSLFAGALSGAASPASSHSSLLGAEVALRPNGEAGLDLDRSFEHGIFLASGDAELEGTKLEVNTLYFATAGRSSLELRSGEGARIVLLGGTPLASPILMWWNFVARTPAEIAAAREAWESGDGFGPVIGHEGPRVPAPPLVRPARPPAQS